MELKEGMYVRTKNGSIDKIIDTTEEYYELEGDEDEKLYKIYKLNHYYYDDEFDEETKWFLARFFVKASNNIIDLIEERDFVKVRIDGIFINWFMVDLFEDENENQELGIGCYEDGLLNSISEYRPLNTLEILEVVTKEQFESMSYKLEE